MMMIEEAVAIVKAINARCLYNMGLCEPPVRLRGVSLAEMIEAKEIVAKSNEKAEREANGGSHSIRLIPDDRLIAAAYCMEHYPCEAEDAIMIMPMSRNEQFWHETKFKALAIVPCNEPEEENPDD